jgi:hypothetical protein
VLVSFLFVSLFYFCLEAFCLVVFAAIIIVELVWDAESPASLFCGEDLDRVFFARVF